MKIKSISYGPITTPCFFPTKQYCEDVFTIDRCAFLNKVKGEVPPQIYCLVKKLDLNFYKNIYPLYIEHVSNSNDKAETLFNLMTSGELDFEDINNVEIIQPEECNSILDYYHNSIISWIKLLTKGQITLSSTNNRILTQDLIEECRKLKEEAIQNFILTAKEQKIPKLTYKKAEIIFWLIIFRIFTACDYKTNEDTKITSKYFCSLVGKGISHNTLDTYNEIHSHNYNGAPGDIEINDSRRFVNVDLFYHQLHGIITNMGK